MCKFRVDNVNFRKTSKIRNSLCVGNSASQVPPKEHKHFLRCRKPLLTTTLFGSCFQETCWQCWYVSRDRCPCTSYFMYSLVMMVGPALFLLGLGFMMSGGFWQSILKTSRMPDVKERCNNRMKSLTKLFQPFLAPMAYITIALLKGDFFVCLTVGSPNESCHSNPRESDISKVRKSFQWLLE